MSKLALVAFSLGLVALSAPVSAQQASGSTSVTSTQQGKPPAARKPKRADIPPSGSSLPAGTMSLPQSGNWSISDALPKGSRAVREQVPERTPLSRVPLEAGSPGTVGFDSLSDSATRPGQEAHGQRAGSYAGMSISVPSLNKNLPLPPLLPPLTGRPD